MNLKLLCFMCLCLVNEIRTYKILGIFPFAAPSHYFLGNELMKGLAKAGHDATIFTVFEEKKPPNEHYKQIVLQGMQAEQQALFNHLTNMSNKDSQNFFANPAKMVMSFFNVLDTITELTLNHTQTQELIKTKPKFDVVIVSQFGTEALKALAAHFDAHLVIFSNHAANSWMNHFVGNPTLPSISPDIILGYTGQMSFIQRVLNTVFASLQYMNFNGLVYPRHAKLVHKYISKDLDLNKILYNVSLALTNSHSSLDKATALVPCVKNIAGFHVQPPKKLPDDLQKYFDNAKHGIIYFSMGSNVKSVNLPDEMKATLMKAFSKRKENILWKFEDDNLPGKPENVKIEKWLPQADLLAHPNVKLFITHGGFLSTIETVYHGVPTIAIPILGDQMKNAKQSELDGYTKVLQFNELSEEILSSAIEEVISNKKYRENVKSRSKIFHDRQIKPMDEAVYWIEYIVRHNGAYHLRVGYLDLPWYQYYLLDVFALIFGVIFVVLFVIKKTIVFILRRLCKSCDQNKTKKVKKQ